MRVCWRLHGAPFFLPLALSTPGLGEPWGSTNGGSCGTSLPGRQWCGLLNVSCGCLCSGASTEQF